MVRKPEGELRRGWTTGACATAAVKAALHGLLGGEVPRDVSITLPKGETPTFAIAHEDQGVDWVEVGITKDAGDDPDVTHGALIVARVAHGAPGLHFVAGSGVGTVTKPGLPINVGEPAINPVPRQMIATVVEVGAGAFNHPVAFKITISIPGGEDLAQKTWNPRLGIVGGLSILGTIGVVRPFSCAAWIASIHRGVDVCRADGLAHVAGCTGATSEKVVQQLYDLPDHAMLDMGDFAGGLLKYLRRNPIDHITIAGGIGKMTKLAQGAGDLHSGRSQVDFQGLGALAVSLGLPDVSGANTALEAFEIAGPDLAKAIADGAHVQVQERLRGVPITSDTVVIDRSGTIIGRAGR